MPVVAALLSAWAAWRWLGFVVGWVRAGRFADEAVRREARQTVVARGALNLVLSVVCAYAWALVFGLNPGVALVGFFAAVVMCSLAVGIAVAFMQPEQRTPETLDVCHVLRPSTTEG